MIRSLLAAALAASSFGAFGAEKIYLLQQEAGSQAALRLLGSAPGARKLALPESGGHLLVLTSEGRVLGWGRNHAGQLGTGNLEPQTELTGIAGLSEVTAIGAGAAYSVALKRDGTVWIAGWGRSSAEPVPGLWNVLRIAAGDDFVLALRADGTVWSFGRTLLPEPVPELWGVAAVSAKGAARYAADASGRLWKWTEDSVLRSMDGDDPEASIARELSAEAAMPSQWRGLALRADRDQLHIGAGAYAFSGTLRELVAGWTVAAIAGAASASVESPAVDDPAAALAPRKIKASGGAGSLGERFLSSSPLITAYEKHNIYIQAGKACAFGENSEGQLGDGTATDRSSAVPLALLPSLVSVSTSQYHSAAAASDGALYTWGYNASGQLGDGTSIQRVTPFPVGGFTGASAVAVGAAHTLVLKNDGTVWAFGANGSGQLGDGSFTNRNVPVQVINLTGVIAISAGSNYSIALKSDGTVWGWGANSYGNLGDGTVTARSSPVQAVGLSGVTAIAASYYHTLVLKNDSTVWGFGYNGYGALGDGSTTNRATAVRAGTLTGAVSIGSGEYHSLVVLSDGTVRAFGLNNQGQLGDGTVTNRISPVQVSGLSGVARVAGGSLHSIAAKTDGSIWAWGDNSNYQLGVATTTDNTIPAASLACATDPTPGSGPAISTAGRFISARETHSLAIRPSGVAVGFGENSEGELGDASSTDRNTPSQVAGLSGLTSISAGYWHGAASGSDGIARTWGYNGLGRLGDGTLVAKTSPVAAIGLTGVLSVATGLHHTLVLKSDGTVWGFGANGNGQLGDGSNTNRSTAVQVVGLSNVIAISAGQNFSIALKSDGTVWGWGANNYGQLGDGTGTNRSSPVQAIQITGATAIVAGYYHTLILRNDGTVWGFGYNGYGALGDGATTNRYHMTRMGRLTDIVGIGVGEYHSLAIRSNGTVWGAGLNNLGQLGDGSVLSRSVPVQAGSGLSGVIAVTGGSVHSMALRNDGCLMVWGSNASGQFGVASPGASTVPIQGPCGIGPQPGTPPTVASLSPNSATAGAAAFNLDVTGTNFTAQSTVLWNGSARSTTLLNATTLRAQISATDVASAGTFQVSVNDTANGASNSLPFTVTQATTTVGSVSNPSPANTATGVSTTTSFSWTAAVNASSYDVYFGTSAPPIFVANISGTTYNPGPLTPNVTYYWKVIARNGAASGPDPGVWQFTVGGIAAGYRFIPVTPCRVADTRVGQGFTGNFGPPTLNGGDVRNLPIPSGVCGIPSTARAYSFNVTVVPSEPLSYLTMWPTGQGQPLVSTLNSFHGGIVANAAIVPAGTNGGVSVYVTNRTDVIVDINGYFADTTAGGSYAFYSVDPCRLADTRAGSGFTGLFGSPTPGAGSTRSFPLAGSCTLPAAAAYSLNVTVVPPAPLAFLTLFPTGSAQPVVSTLNSFDGAIVANAALVPAGSNGAVSAFVTHVTDIILDVNGYFGTPGAANQLLFEPVTPCRVADTRIAGQGAPIMNAGTTKDFPVAGLCGVPANARAYSLNVTVVPTGGLSFLTLWPAGKSRPLVSTLNSFLGRVVANAAIAPAGTNGNVSVFVTDQTHVIIDINGYFR